MVGIIRDELIARACHNVNKAYCEAIGDMSQPSWEDAPDWQKEGTKIGVKLHIEAPNAGPKVFHESWLAEKEEK